MNHATLNVISGPLKGQALILGKRRMMLGADAASDVKLEGYAGVSPHHALLMWDGEQFLLQDVGSEKGIFADGRMVPREIGPASVVLPGESIEMGDFVARLWQPLTPIGFIDDGPPPPARKAKEDKTVAPGPRRSFPVLACLCILGFGALGAWRVVRAMYGALDRAVVSNLRATQPTADLPAAAPTYNLDPNVAATVKAATVMIARRVNGGWISGSGFVAVDARRIVTNRHVVVDEGSGQIQRCTVVFYSGTAQETRVDVDTPRINLAPRSSTGDDFTDDLAVLTLDTPVAAALPLGRTENLAQAVTVYAAGFPLDPTAPPTGNTLPAATVTAEAVQRVSMGVVNGQNAVTMLQLTGAVTHGNSGGPVVNDRGEVVGVISRGNEAGTAYAIPAAYVQGLP